MHRIRGDTYLAYIYIRNGSATICARILAANRSSPYIGYVLAIVT